MKWFSSNNEYMLNVSKEQWDMGAKINSSHKSLKKWELFWHSYWTDQTTTITSDLDCLDSGGGCKNGYELLKPCHLLEAHYDSWRFIWSCATLVHGCKTTKYTQKKASEKALANQYYSDRVCLVEIPVFLKVLTFSCWFCQFFGQISDNCLPTIYPFAKTYYCREHLSPLVHFVHKSAYWVY